MNKIFTIIAVLIASHYIHAQSTEADSTKTVLDEYNAIDTRFLQRIVYRDVTTQTDTINFTVYCDRAKGIKILIAEVKKGTITDKYSFYLRRNRDLLFLLQEHKNKSGEEFQKRFYYYNNNVFRVLHKSRNATSTISFDKIENTKLTYTKEEHERVSNNTKENYNVLLKALYSVSGNDLRKEK